MNFPWQQWNTLLVGTDISKTAIETAQKGIYGKWSFRQVSPELQQKYFYNHHNLFQVNEKIRRKVKFLCGNLLKDTYPRPGGDLFDFDLILCRNVFIYLDSHAIGTIIQKFHDSLNSQGYLMTGHTELYGQDTSRFQVISFPESVVYRQRNWATAVSSVLPTGGDRVESNTQVKVPSVLPRRTIAQHNLASRANLLKSASVVPIISTARPGQRAQQSPQTQPNDWQTALKEAEQLLHQEAYDKAIYSAEKIFAAYPHCDAAVKVAAHAYANIGSHEEAKSLCQRVLKRQPLSVDMYYLLAQIAEEQNQLDMTKDYLRKIIYLDSSFVRAYLDLASIYEREKQPEKMKKMKAYALVLLDKLAPDTILDTHTGTTAQQWKEHLQRIC
jgi:chemotaxis protein methyltransferase CheR